eukprot:TRINITY_DN2430_c0_g1::TRINITY_DN2430_c0_g1_i1::g.8976::m.8976 TRINITY_DN2430_c0_g1::TRINITY_DN2430_c0_g1_i1::g.8976  ORF type:complete len:276 (+),score=100.29,sp/Q24439/ATPO_DROME/33.87/6e-30,OSCP/PF00213.13/3.1e-40 TRINITY_DN2430_c0_g1_i1:36-863(+)
MASFLSQVRRLSTSAPRLAKAAEAAAAPELPLVQLGGLQARYGRALFALGLRNKNLEELASHLQEFNNARSNNAALRDFCNDPSIPRLQKQKLLEDALTKTQLSPILKNFLGTLAQSGRLKDLDNISEGFAKLMEAYKKQLVVTLVTATPASTQVKSDLEALIKKHHVKGNQQLEVRTQVDPSILGGLTLTIGNQYVDMSVRTQLQEIRTVLGQSVTPAISADLRQQLEKSDARGFTLAAAVHEQGAKEFDINSYHAYRQKYDKLITDAAIKPKI